MSEITKAYDWPGRTILGIPHTDEGVSEEIRKEQIETAGADR